MGIKILVVDDDKQICRMLERRLKKEGYTVTLASSGEQALDKLKKKRVDMVLLDHQMSDMDGLETFEKMKELGLQVPVVMLTAHGSIPLALSFIKAGGNDFEEKPIDFDVLQVKIERALKNYSLLKDEVNKRELAETKLQQSYDELESRVQERTAELITANKQLQQQIDMRQQAESVIKDKDAQLRRGHKLDALGNLTGGIAHDFNNMLNIVMGFARLLKQREDDPEKLNYINELCYAAERSADLTRKLLAFSANVVAKPEPVDINVVLWRDMSMLQKLLTSRIELNMNLQDDLWFVWMDLGELEDLILNLSINAMHAMQGVGCFTLTSSNTSLDTKTALEIGLQSGEYVLLSFEDTGQGMDKETEGRLFEPFYTTKGDKGTGLGLSQVYGVVRKAGGSIKVTTAPSKGTRFDLYFPRHTMKPKNDLATNSAHESIDLSGTETILVVEDVALIQRLNEMILMPYGYRVLLASNGEQAVNILEKEDVNLLLTDLSMPGMDGYQLVKACRQRWPNLKIIVLSGYQEADQLPLDADGGNVVFLQKPASPEQLLSKVRSLLDTIKTVNAEAT